MPEDQAPLHPPGAPPAASGASQLRAMAQLEAEIIGAEIVSAPTTRPSAALSALLSRALDLAEQTTHPRDWALLLRDLALTAAQHFALEEAAELALVYADLAARLERAAGRLPVSNPT